MAQCYVSAGSNIEPARHVRACIAALATRFGRLAISPVYESEAVGFDGEPFLNLVVGFQAREGPHEVARVLRRIEAQQGRVRGGEKFDARTLDLDLLLYDELILNEGGLQLPRAEIERYAFVLRPLADLAPGARYPLDGRTYEQMWAEFGGDRHGLKSIDLPLEPHEPEVHP